MNSQIAKLVIFLLIFQWGCSETPKTDPLLEEAFLVHKTALETEEEVHGMLDQLPANDSFRVAMDSRLESWGENLIEVPGFEHEHDHEDGHHHHHHNSQPEIELTAEEMLAVQQQLLDSVLAIKNEVLLHGQGSEK